MTKQEAIQILSTRDAHGALCGYTSGVPEAVDMAIEALTREQQIIENGYTGKEMRFRMDGKLFAVRELAQ